VRENGEARKPSRRRRLGTWRRLSHSGWQTQHEGPRKQGNEVEIQSRLGQAGLKRLHLDIGMPVGDPRSTARMCMFGIVSVDTRIFEVDLSAIIMTRTRGFDMAVLVQARHLHEQQEQSQNGSDSRVRAETADNHPHSLSVNFWDQRSGISASAHQRQRPGLRPDLSFDSTGGAPVAMSPSVMRSCNMLKLDLLLVLWLSLSVPTAALASVVSAEHCQRGKTASSAMAGHAQHAMYADMQMNGDHLQHLDHAAKPVKASDDNGCSCGCNCGSTHCASSCASFMAIGTFKGALAVQASSRLFLGDPARPATAHHLDLLRPPSLI
jgi:hypothetical protein